MLWPLLTFLAALATLVLAFPIVAHAYRRSVGTAVMVTCIPGYFFLYAFSQFRHRHRPLIVPLLLGVSVLTGVFGGLATSGMFKEQDRDVEVWTP